MGAWSIDISYDPSVVSPVSCATEHGAVCNTHFNNDTIRVAGATAIGIEGDTKLATLTFQCADAEGKSAITVSLADFADATLGGPRQISADIDNGEVNCTRATPPPGLAGTGTGGPTSGSDLSWLMATLAGAGVVALAGYGALRARTRS